MPSHVKNIVATSCTQAPAKCIDGCKVMVKLLLNKEATPSKPASATTKVRTACSQRLLLQGRHTNAIRSG
jgi:hypothetical protein